MLYDINSVITNYLHRVYKIFNTWQDFHNEIEHIKQILINNFPNYLVDKLIKNFIEKEHNISITKKRTKQT